MEGPTHNLHPGDQSSRDPNPETMHQQACPKPNHVILCCSLSLHTKDLICQDKIRQNGTLKGRFRAHTHQGGLSTDEVGRVKSLKSLFDFEPSLIVGAFFTTVLDKAVKPPQSCFHRCSFYTQS